MSHPCRSLLIALLALTAFAGLPTASASANLQVGMGDQKSSMFADARFQKLKLKHARYVMPYDAVLTNDWQTTETDAWLAAARAQGIAPLVTFNHSRNHMRAPSVAEYTTAFKAFRARYPWVKNVSPWNEANHVSQPTYRNPKRAAQYYNVARSLCKGCRIVAADVLDGSNMERWLKVFRRTAKKPKLWGLHNYSDTNRFRTSGTKRLLKAVKGEVWVTESGGVVRFQATDGRIIFPYNEKRAARSLAHSFKLTKLNRKRITRLYLYHWQGVGTSNRWDSGVIDEHGKARPALKTLQRELAKLR